MAPSSNSPNKQNSKNSGKKVNSEETAGGTDRGKTLYLEEGIINMSMI